MYCDCVINWLIFILINNLFVKIQFAIMGILPYSCEVLCSLIFNYFTDSNQIKYLPDNDLSIVYNYN